jgi:hypothetical protein
VDTWFDSHAKRSAARVEDAAPSTFNRRRFLARTAVVGGVAWTAPTILSASPAWAGGASTCTSVQHYCAGDSSCCNLACNQATIQPTCCTTQYCGVIPGTTTPNCCQLGTASGTCTLVTNLCPGTLGGSCANSGQGVAGCISNTQHCNGDKTNDICGGLGAQCSTTADCFVGTCKPENPSKNTCQK